MKYEPKTTRRRTEIKYFFISIPNLFNHSCLATIQMKPVNLFGISIFNNLGSEKASNIGDAVSKSDALVFRLYCHL